MTDCKEFKKQLLKNWRVEFWYHLYSVKYFPVRFRLWLRRNLCRILGHRWRWVISTKYGVEYIRMDLTYCLRCKIWLRDALKR